MKSKEKKEKERVSFFYFRHYTKKTLSTHAQEVINYRIVNVTPSF